MEHFEKKKVKKKVNDNNLLRSYFRLDQRNIKQ